LLYSAGYPEIFYRDIFIVARKFTLLLDHITVQIRLIVADGQRGVSVCLSVCLSLTVVSPAKTPEPIEMPFGIWTRMDPRKHVLDGDAH